ncbi:MAG TPA: sodium-independent anion transporter [Verrucomicrobiales bacterium]|nr:sodium-independent anion transporter [Verrucomicrobiales bacterium]
MSTQPIAKCDEQASWLKRLIPALDWLAHYERKHLPGDARAGVIVATLLIPQGMAYALLAGLPPQFGLYASLLPIAVYALLGSSRFLSAGPSALLSLLIATGVAGLAEPGSPRYLAFATATALVVGVMQIAMGAARLGVLTNFLSQPVLSGFTSAAACLIALSQVKHLLGVQFPQTEHLHELLAELARALPQTRWPTLAISMASVLLLLAFQYLLPRVLARWKTFPAGLAQALSKSGPIIVVIVGTAIVAAFDLGQRNGVNIIGEIPSGLPDFALPALAASEFLPLIPLALTVSFVGFLESISVAKTLAAKRRQKVESNQELIALGAANLAAGVTGGYPVSSSFARSMVNFTAGANTGLASLITVAVIGVSALFLMPLFHHLPQAALAAIIIIAVIGLMDFAMPRRLWRYNKADAAALILTFVAVLAVGIEKGILIGAASTIILYLWRTSRPHMAVVGRVANTEHFRNVRRHETQTLPHVLLLRIDENLYFANAKHIEDFVLCAAAEQPRLRHLVLICSAINFIDASALETLRELLTRLRDADIQLHLAEVKGPVMDRLAHTEFLDQLGHEHVFLSTQAAYEKLAAA